MRHLSLTALVLSFLLMLPSASAQKTVIAGQIENRHGGDDITFVRIGVDRLAGEQSKYRAKLDSQGQFVIAFELQRPQDVWISLAGRTYSILAFPDDSLSLTFHIKEDSTEVHFQGENAMLNELYFQMLQSYSRRFLSDKNEILQLDLPDYLNSRLEMHEQEKLFIAAFAQNWPEGKLRNWIAHYQVYSLANDLIRFPYRKALQEGKNIHEMEIPDEYFLVLDSIPINNEEALYCSAYLRFLQDGFYNRLFQLTKLEPEFENPGPHLDIFVRFFIENTDGLARDVVLTKWFSEMMQYNQFKDELHSYFEEYFNTVENGDLRQVILKKYQLLYELSEEDQVDSIDNVMMVDSGSIDLFQSLRRTYPDNAIYIDLWATWCQPCMAELGYYNELIESFKDKPIVFVFFAYQSPKKLWAKIIADRKLQGIHHRISEEEYFHLEQYVELSGFPQRILINVDGKIVNTNLKVPIIGANGEISESLISKIKAILPE